MVHCIYLFPASLLSGWSRGRFWKSAWQSTSLSFFLEFSNFSSSSTMSSSSSLWSSSLSSWTSSNLLFPPWSCALFLYFSSILSRSDTMSVKWETKVEKCYKMGKVLVDPPPVNGPMLTNTVSMVTWHFSPLKERIQTSNHYECLSSHITCSVPK